MSEELVYFTSRIPRSIVDHADELAYRAGLSRAQLIRILLKNVTEDQIPRAFFEEAEALRV